MPRNAKKRKKIAAADINSWATKVMEATTGVKVPADLVEREKALIAEEKAKNPAAVALGRLGGLKGGKARAKSLTAKQRSDIAKKAVETRWKRRDKITKLVQTGFTANEVATRMGVSVQTVLKTKKSISSNEPLAT